MKGLLLSIALLFQVSSLVLGAIPVTAQDTKALPPRPVFHIDVHSNVKGPDPVSTVFLKPVIDGLDEVFDIRPNHVPLNEEGFELRVFIVVNDDQYYVSFVLLAKLKNEDIRIYVCSDVLVTTKMNAEVDGQATFNDLAQAIDKFLDTKDEQ